MARNMKKELTLRTYEILKAEGIENITIRYIASKAGCTSTVIYRHFEDLDHLLAFSSIRILKNYFHEFKEIISGDGDMLDLNYKLWERFACYAFDNVHIFELLFWGRHNEKLGDMIFEYYSLFKDEMDKFDGLSASILFNENLKDREETMLRRAAATGCLPSADAVMLAELVVYLFHGILLEYRDSYREAGKTQEGAERFLKILGSIYDKYRIK